MKLIDWGRNIDLPDEDPFAAKFPVPPGQWPAKDTKLLDKIKAVELPGIFRRLIDGLCDYLESGFVEPASVTIATDDYRDKSDPLARFLRLCTEADSAERVKSSELHDVYKAWCQAAGVKEWTPNGFAEAMMDKGFPEDAQRRHAMDRPEADPVGQ
jgi:putative DNA primase/helicase